MKRLAFTIAAVLLASPAGAQTPTFTVPGNTIGNPTTVVGPPVTAAQNTANMAIGDTRSIPLFGNLVGINSFSTKVNGIINEAKPQ